jgi:catechol 2,3-dioxygenase-like lactoylglutathione lyase family enzyme
MVKFQFVTPRLPVSDLARTIEFYTQVLAFQIDLLWPETAPTFCILERDGVSLSFFTRDGQKPEARPGVGELYIEIERVRELHAELAGKVHIEWGPEVYSYRRREFAIRDPDGYLVIFTEPTDDPPTCDV